MMYVYDKDNPRSEDYGEGFADGYSRAKEEFTSNEQKTVTEFSTVLINYFTALLDNYAETDNRVEIAVVKQDFFDSLDKTLGCYKPAE